MRKYSFASGDARRSIDMRRYEDLIQKAVHEVIPNAINNNVSGHYKLMADIDLNDVDFTPIGNVDSGPFSGTFDGNGFTISNLSVFTGKYAGLFGYNEGEIKNVKLKNIYIYGTRYVGGIAAYNAATGVVKDSSVLSGSVESVGGIYVTDIGGIVGFSNGALSGCINRAKEKFNNSGKNANCGGIVGEYDSKYELSGCKNYGNIFAASQYSNYDLKSERYGYGVGGVVGKLKCFRLSKCSNYGNIKNYGNYTGGIIGISDYSDGLVKQCQNSSYLYSEQPGFTYLGGICGASKKAITFEECLNSGYIHCEDRVSDRAFAGGDFWLCI